MPTPPIVASGGTLTIGGVTVTLTGATTLRQLADAINATSVPAARASVVQSGPSSYRLVLSAKDTGQANAFTVSNNLTGGTGVAFGDADGDGVSGDDLADNAQQAIDASLLVNNIPVTSTTNTIATAIPGVTFTAFKKDPAASVIIDVSTDSTGLKDNVKSFVTAYNDLVALRLRSGGAGRQERPGEHRPRPGHDPGQEPAAHGAVGGVRHRRRLLGALPGRRRVHAHRPVVAERDGLRRGRAESRRTRQDLRRHDRHARASSARSTRCSTPSPPPTASCRGRAACSPTRPRA